MTRELLKDLDARPSAPDTDELREKFRIVKARTVPGWCFVLENSASEARLHSARTKQGTPGVHALCRLLPGW